MLSGIALALLFTLGWVPVFLCRTEQLGDALPQLNRGERAATFASIAAVSVHMALGCVLLTSRPLSPIDVVVGLIVFAAGFGVWYWGRSQISPLWMRRLPDQPPLRLRRNGAFGLVRHPLYLGILLLAAAPLAVARASILSLTYAACVGAILTRILQEERRLHAQLGEEYSSYCREVSRLIPFVW